MASDSPSGNLFGIQEAEPMGSVIIVMSDWISECYRFELILMSHQISIFDQSHVLMVWSLIHSRQSVMGIYVSRFSHAFSQSLLICFYLASGLP
jgi:hypothetical protein